MLLVELAHPLAERVPESNKGSLSLRSIGVGGKIIVAVAGAWNDVDGDIRSALHLTSWTPIGRDGGASPWVEFTVDPEQALCIDVAPAASMLVDGMVGAGALETMLEAVLVRELVGTSCLYVIFPRPERRKKACGIKSAPSLPPLETGDAC